MSKGEYVISKILSANDTGETGGHQAGILVPKDSIIQQFFPKLNSDDKNPRILIAFTDDLEDKWLFSYIYYNNKFFGGTRNEFRLTGMTKFFRLHNLKTDDELIFRKNINGRRFISYRREANHMPEVNDGVLKLRSGKWKIINL
jgi:hypothetical protein